MYQTVAYMRLKTVENVKIVRPKSGCSHLIMRGSDYRAFPEKILVFWMGGCL